MKRFFTLCLVLLCSSLLCAADIETVLDSLLSPATAAALLEKGKIQNIVYREKGTIPSLVPATPLAKEALVQWSGPEAPFFVETLYLYKKNNSNSAQSIVDVSKPSVILRSISTLQGIEYFSSSRNKMRTLYEKSWAIDTLQAKNRIADPVAGSAEGKTVFALQKDLTFGEYIYRYEYRQDADSVAFFSRNIDSMNYLFLKVIDAEKLRVSLVIKDLGDYLLVYGLTRAEFVAIPGIEGKLNKSFSTRADALYNWFIHEYENK